MPIDYDARLLRHLHAKHGVKADVTPPDGPSFSVLVLRRAPTATLKPFQGSTTATNLNVFEVRRAVWVEPTPGSRIVIAGEGALELQSARPDERQPDIWLLDCIPA